MLRPLPYPPTSRPRAGASGRPGIVLHRSSRSTTEDRAVREGIPVTSVARTLLDLAEVGAAAGARPRDRAGGATLALRSARRRAADRPEPGPARTAAAHGCAARLPAAGLHALRARAALSRLLRAGRPAAPGREPVHRGRGGRHGRGPATAWSWSSTATRPTARARRSSATDSATRRCSSPATACCASRTGGCGTRPRSGARLRRAAGPRVAAAAVFRHLYVPPGAGARSSSMPSRLTPLDGSFLRLETPNAHMHVAWSGLFEPHPDLPRPTVEALREKVAARLDRVPRFRQRLASRRCASRSRPGSTTQGSPSRTTSPRWATRTRR